MIIVSAPGKLILLGEHAVVYGQPCIVTAVDMRLTVQAEVIDAVAHHVDTQGANTRFVDAALAWAASNWGMEKKLKLIVSSPFSGKYGFGSSAAVTVATLKACATLNNTSIDHRGLFEAGVAVVRSVQGMGSGVDVAAAVWGGTIFFADNGATVEQVPPLLVPLVIGYSGDKAQTVDKVAEVAEKRKLYLDRVDRIMQAIGEYVVLGKKALIGKDWQRLGKIMGFTQEYLRDLGVSTEKLEALIQATINAGAWGAKLSGAGGGDCMIAIVSGGAQKAVEQAIERADGEVVRVGVGAEGVKVESTDDQQKLQAAHQALREVGVLT